jgi:hypothetical protein
VQHAFQRVVPPLSYSVFGSYANITRLVGNACVCKNSRREEIVTWVAVAHAFCAG